jgi:hypothetical protein
VQVGDQGAEVAPQECGYVAWWKLAVRPPVAQFCEPLDELFLVRGRVGTAHHRAYLNDPRHGLEQCNINRTQQRMNRDALRCATPSAKYARTQQGDLNRTCDEVQESREADVGNFVTTDVTSSVHYCTVVRCSLPVTIWALGARVNNFEFLVRSASVRSTPPKKGPSDEGLDCLRKCARRHAHTEALSRSSPMSLISLGFRTSVAFPSDVFLYCYQSVSPSCCSLAGSVPL